MLKEGLGVKRTFLACGYTDLRYGVDGLAALVQFGFKQDPFEEGTLFLFCGRRKDRIKGLLFEGDGFLLLYKRIEDGRFNWPNTPEELRELSSEEFKRLMTGLAVDPGIRQSNSRVCA